MGQRKVMVVGKWRMGLISKKAAGKQNEIQKWSDPGEEYF